MKSVLAFLPVALASQWDGWSDCGSADDLATLNSVSVSPDPPVKGVPLTFTIDITFKDIGSCPIPPGPLTLTFDETVPKLIPVKHVYGNIKLTHSDSRQIGCIKLDTIVNHNHTVV